MRFFAAVLAVALLGSVPVQAQDDAKGKAGVMSWFKNWKNALERSAVEGKYRKMRTATGVAAVRGSAQSAADPDEAYWKGGWSEKREKERAKERGELAAAVGLIMEGKGDEARAALSAFEKEHPKSSFLGEVKEARAKLDEMEGKAPAAAPAEAKPEAAPKAEAPAEPKPEAKAEAKPEAAAEAAAEAPAEAAKAEEPKAEKPAEAAPEAKPAE